MRWLFLLLLLPLSALAQINLCSNTYTVHATINLTSTGSITIRGDSINSVNSSIPCIQLTNYTSVTIKRCKLINSTAQGILLTNCKNVTIDSCDIENVSDGVHHNYSSGWVKMTNCYVKNIRGPFPLGNGIQLNNVNSGGILIQNNFFECIDDFSRHPQDIISVFQSAGLPGDSIMILNNFIKGGQVNNDSGGAAGIVLGDVGGGGYQVARGNRLVNPGAVGIQVQGSHSIKADHNYIYGDGHGALSFEGIEYGNYSGDTTYAVEMSYNTIYWRQTAAHSFAVFNRWVDKASAVAASTASGHVGGPTLPDPINWITNTQTNIAGATNTSIAPTPMITACSGPPPPPPPPPPLGGDIVVTGAGPVKLQ